MNLKNFTLSFSLLLISLVAQAKYTCSSLFVEKISFEEQYQNAVKSGKIRIIRDFPIASEDHMNLKDSELSPGKEFLVRFPDLDSKTQSRISVGSLSTFGVHGIRHIPFRILKVNAVWTQIQIDSTNSDRKLHLIRTEDLKNLKAFRIKSWEKRQIELPIQLDPPFEEKTGAYTLRHLAPSGEKEIAASVQLTKLSEDRVSVDLSDTKYLYRQNHLNGILVAQFFTDHPRIRHLMADFADDNQLVFSQAFSGENQATEKKYLANQVHEIAQTLSEGELMERIRKAIQKTPYYKANQRWGFTEISEIQFSHSSSNTFVSFTLSKPEN